MEIQIAVVIKKRKTPGCHMILLVLAIVLSTTLVQCSGCSMYGMCNNTLGLYCYNQTNPQPLDDPNWLSIFTDLCDTDYGGQICCDRNQFDVFASKLSMADSILKSCPACKRNFKRIWCDFTCAPNQSDFLNVTNVVDGTLGYSVTAVDVVVTSNFSSGLFDSCKDVSMGMSNQKVWQFMVSGRIVKKPIDFLNAFGISVSDGGNSPYSMIFNENSQGLNTKMVKCNDPEYKCECVDCLESCAKPEDWSQDETCTLGQLPCITVYGIVGYITLIVILTLSWMAYKMYKTRQFNRRVTTVPNEESEPIARLTDHLLSDGQQMFQNHLNNWLCRFFFFLGLFSSRYPKSVLTATLVLIVLSACSFLWNEFQIETDPAKLWVGPTSTSLAQKDYFDNEFGPFYRIQQILITTKSKTPILSKESIDLMFKIENDVYNLSESLNSVCYQAIPGRCMIQTVTDIWKDYSTFLRDSDWKKTAVKCLNDPTGPNCLFGDRPPIIPRVILGGYKDLEYENATTFVMTIMLNNYVNASLVAPAVAWEELLRSYLGSLETRYDLKEYVWSYSTESSLSIELNRETKANAIAIAISYCCMFVYVMIALGRFTTWKRILLDSKVTLSVAGIVVVGTAVLFSAAFWNALRLKTTMIIAEVIPFLVLAIGVDNIFILVHALDETDPSYSVEQRVALAVAKGGPSITLCALTETVAFLVGGMVEMPAVKTFSLYAAVAVFSVFILQITAFVAVLSLDLRREIASRMDVMCCFPSSTVPNNPSPLHSFIKQVYAPWLMKSSVSQSVLFLAFLTLFSSFFGFGYLNIGLDQRIALPRDSYLVDYFNDISEYLMVGPPLYFVVKNVNATDREGQFVISSKYWDDLNEYSLGAMVEVNRQNPESYIAAPVSVWIDDYFAWLNSDSCCQYKFDACMTLPDDDRSLNKSLKGTSFLSYMKKFLSTVPDSTCAFGGKAAYENAVVVDPTNVTIVASHFRTYHSVLKTQQDFIKALRAARRMASLIEDRNRKYQPNIQVFPYSIFYIFFEQYLTVEWMALQVLCSALVAIFLLTFGFLSSFSMAVLVTLSVLSVLLHMIGVMALLDISLNALSVVNLAIAAGISIEFCSHIARAYLVAPGKKSLRVQTAMSSVGSSVFSGITMTKFIGVLLLLLAPSKIFEVFYFRMYIGIIVIGFLHGFMYLPVLLSFFGPAYTMTSEIKYFNTVDEMDDDIGEIESNK